MPCTRTQTRACTHTTDNWVTGFRLRSGNGGSVVGAAGRLSVCTQTGARVAQVDAAPQRPPPPHTRAQNAGASRGRTSPFLVRLPFRPSPSVRPSDAAVSACATPQFQSMRAQTGPTRAPQHQRLQPRGSTTRAYAGAGCTGEADRARTKLPSEAAGAAAAAPDPAPPADGVRLTAPADDPPSSADCGRARVRTTANGGVSKHVNKIEPAAPRL
jgi:hypothetical protein